MLHESQDANASPGDKTSPSKNTKLEQMRARLRPSLFTDHTIVQTVSDLCKKEFEVDNAKALPKSDCNSPALGTMSDKKKNFERIRANMRTHFSLSVTGTQSFFGSGENISKKNENGLEAADNSDTTTKTTSLNNLNIKNEKTPVDCEGFSPENNLFSTGSRKSIEVASEEEKVGGTEEMKNIRIDNLPDVFENEIIEDVTPMTHTIFQRFVSYEEEKFGSPDEHVHYITNSFNDYFEEYEILGEGTSGTVKRCIKKANKQEYAVKIVNYRGDEELKVLIITEFRNLQKLKHKNIVEVIELYVDESRNKIYTILELVKGREMFDVIHEHGSYSEYVASTTFKQILLAIQYMHFKGVCHRDLKPNNILVSEDGLIVKITDFNVSKFSEEDKKSRYTGLSNENYRMWTYTGTIAFTAPEVFTDTEYTEAVDMWSAGVVLYTMLSGCQPFQAEYVSDLIELIKKGEISFQEAAWEKVSPEAKDLVIHLLNKNYKERYSPSQALAHPWIQNIKKVSAKKMSATIQNLKCNVRRNARQGFLHEPMSGLIKRPEIMEAEFNEEDTPGPVIRKRKNKLHTVSTLKFHRKIPDIGADGVIENETEELEDESNLS